MEAAGATFSHVTDKPHFAEEEVRVLKFWKDNKIFNKCREMSKGRTEFSFYDGPPFATGLPHYGHILAGTIKDVITRYAYQTGHNVERRFGWDCHGLPVEYEIDKELGITCRQDITEKLGIANYNDKCKSVVMKYASEWEHVVERMGRWIDFENGYKTMDYTFMESVWWVFKQLFDMGRVYRDFKVMPYSMACTTPLSNFEANQNYKDVADPSVVVAFPQKSTGGDCLLAWTTTPWTLPSNLALAAHPTMTYIRFKLKNKSSYWICAECRLRWLLKELRVPIPENLADVMKGTVKSDEIEVAESGFTGQKLEGLEYVPPFDFFSRNPYWATRAFKVVCADFVDMESGTGMVHCAPAFGEDDYDLMLKKGIIEKSGDIPCPVDESGRFIDPVDDGRIKGKFIKEADKTINQILKEKGLLLVNSEIVHSYPFCWRSDTPLMYRAVRSWFVDVESMKNLLLQNNQQTRWVPSFIQEKRFHNWLANARDWCISRNRFWGTPIPLWISEDATQKVCIGSIAELQKYTDQEIVDIHRQYIDHITIPDPRGPDFPPLRRVDEVFDCWFESGSMPYAQRHYPFENVDLFEKSFPADFVGEGLDQTRGWFYTLSVLGAALFGKAPFKNLIVNGLVLAQDGKKMSKRLKNYPDPMEVASKYGADSLRLFLVSSPVVRAESVRFKEDSVREMVKSVFLPWYHAYRFFVQEVTRYEMGGTKYVLSTTSAYKSENLMDKWILSLTHSLMLYFHEEMTNYRLYTSLPRLLNYLESLTNWYLRMNRDRMRGNANSGECVVALSCMFEVLLTLTRLMCPFTPFTAELIYQNLRNGLPADHPLKMESVHFLMLPTGKEEYISKATEAQVEDFRSVVVLGRLLREKQRVTIKTPLKEIRIVGDNQTELDRLASMESYIQDELNAMRVVFEYNADAVDVSAVPNFRKLGERVGKDMPQIAAELKNMSSAQLKNIFKNDPPRLTLCGHDLNEDELILKRVPNPSLVLGRKDLALESDNKFVVIGDFTVTPELIQLATVREIVTRVQKLRKFLGLKVDDDDVLMYAGAGPNSKTIQTTLTTQSEAINGMLRRTLLKLSDKSSIQNVLAQETYEIQDETLILCFCRT